MNKIYSWIKHILNNSKYSYLKLPKDIANSTRFVIYDDTFKEIDARIKNSIERKWNFFYITLNLNPEDVRTIIKVLEANKYMVFIMCSNESKCALSVSWRIDRFYYENSKAV